MRMSPLVLPVYLKLEVMSACSLHFNANPNLSGACLLHLLDAKIFVARSPEFNDDGGHLLELKLRKSVERCYTGAPQDPQFPHS